MSVPIAIRSASVSLAAALCLPGVMPRPAAAITIRIPADQPTIQSGIDAAVPGDTVLVAPGVYSGPSNRNLDFGGKNLRLISTAGAAETILDGELADARGIHFHRGESFTTLVEGFTFRNFRPTTSTPSPDGAGILTEPGCTPLIQHCVFSGNVAAGGRGGGMCTAGGSVQYCRFEGNGSGGGVPGLGGGVYVDGATLFSCTIRENWASDFQGIAGAGGGVAIPGGSLNRCTIIGNTAAIGGGVFADCPLVSLYLTSCTIAGNQARISGGGIAARCQSGSDLLLDRCIVWGNGTCGSPDVLLDGAEMTAVFMCSLVDPASVGGAGTPDYGPGCVFEDPHFCDPDDCAGVPPFSDGYELASDSLARAQNNSCGQLMGASWEACSVATVSDAGVPGPPSLGPPAPNPASAEVRFALAGALPAAARVQVYDVAGRLVRTLHAGQGDPGPSDSVPVGGPVTWDLRDQAGARVPQGVYFVRLRLPDHMESRAFVVAR
jgi:hypothetical protein